MKIIVITTILSFVLIAGLNAQTETTFPTLQGTDVVFRSEESLTFQTITVSDGIGDPYKMGRAKNDVNDPAKLVAQTIGEIKKQGYKLITSNSGSYFDRAVIMVTYYIFQKD